MKGICYSIVWYIVLFKTHKCVNITIYHGYKDFKGGSIPSFKKLWSTYLLNAPSKRGCLAVSVLDERCDGFLYDSDTGVCTGVDTGAEHSSTTYLGQQSSQSSLSTVTEKLVFYHVGPRSKWTGAKDLAGPSLGIPCKRNQDCRMKKSVCYSGICLCKLGLYFSLKQNACLRECDEYGDGMDIYKEESIGNNNNKIYHNTTLTSCCELCVREKAFTCLTAEWCTNGLCNLSKIGYLDVFFLFRQHYQRDWILAQRRCK